MRLRHRAVPSRGLREVQHDILFIDTVSARRSCQRECGFKHVVHVNLRGVIFVSLFSDLS